MTPPITTPAPNLVPFVHHDLALREAAWVNDRPYFSRLAIGRFLEYRLPQDSIDRLVRRNPHLNNPQWSVQVRLTSTDGKKYLAKLYDPIGLMMIILESRQPRAHLFKLASVHLVAAYMEGKLSPARCVPGVRGVLFHAPWSRARADAQRALAAEHGWTRHQVRYRVDRVRRGLPEMGRPGFRFVTTKYKDTQREALRLRRQRVTLREIAERLHVPISTVGYWSQRAAEAAA